MQQISDMFELLAVETLISSERSWSRLRKEDTALLYSAQKTKSERKIPTMLTEPWRRRQLFKIYFILHYLFLICYPFKKQRQYKYRVVGKSL